MSKHFSYSGVWWTTADFGRNPPNPWGTSGFGWAIAIFLIILLILHSWGII